MRFPLIAAAMNSSREGVYIPPGVIPVAHVGANCRTAPVGRCTRSRHGSEEDRNGRALHDATTRPVRCSILGAMRTMNRIFAGQVGRLAFGGVLLAGVSFLVAALG